MKKTTINYYCDLCEKEIDANEKIVKNTLETEVQVLFTTEQNEGRSTEPYIQKERLHLCNSCLEKYKRSLPIIASGAQGYNNYSWR